MKKILLILSVVLIVCFVGANSIQLNADFYWQPEIPNDLQEVHFYDNSTGDIIAWIWYFGDGESSTLQNPLHIYPDDGEYTVRLVIIDSSGNTSYTEKNITVLNVPPVADAGEDFISNSSQVIFNGSASYDSDGFIVDYAWNFGDGGVAYGSIVAHIYINDGIYNVMLNVVDDDGENDNDTLNVTVDTTPPETIYFLSEEREWYNEDVVVNLSASDNLTGVNKTYYKINDDDWQEYIENFTIIEEGIHEINFYSKDVAGNREEEKSFTLKIDHTLPETKYEIDATYGKDGWIKDKAVVTLNASDNLSGIYKTYYKIDDDDWQEYENEFTFSVNGIHKIYFYSKDNAGNNEEEKNFTLKIDKKKPTVSLKLPEKGYIYIANRRIMPTLFGNTFIIGKFTAEAEADDTTSGVDYVEFILNGEILWRDYVAPYRIELPQTFPISCGNEIKVVAYDKAGNSEESEILKYVKIF
ncbi:MAG TPA: PKD domain-containing protein [Thermoplasmata archaeon]|nr:PKD domain-containing protein [Thermoplasmata archaeon]